MVMLNNSFKMTLMFKELKNDYLHLISCTYIKKNVIQIQIVNYN